MTMTDREMLEFAAKACGYHLVRMCDPVESGNEGSDYFHLDGRYWNPLTEDGDALRLAVKLGMILDIDTEEHVTTVDYTTVYGDFTIVEGHGLDAESATRRAIVRAAAEIGRAAA